MPEELIKVEFGPTPLRLIPTPAFVAIFLAGGTFLTTVVTVCGIGSMGVLMSFGVIEAFYWMKVNGLAHFAWMLVAAVGLLWIPLNTFFYSAYINKFSELGGERRLFAAVLLLIASLPLLLFEITLLLHGSATTAGLVIPFGLACGVAAEVVACIRIYRRGFAPISSMAQLPSAKHREESQALLLEAQKVETREDLNEVAIKALTNFGINKIKLKSSTTAPLEVLIEVLVKQNKIEVANAISKNYLRIVENEKV